MVPKIEFREVKVYGTLKEVPYLGFILVWEYTYAMEVDIPPLADNMVPYHGGIGVLAHARC